MLESARVWWLILALVVAACAAPEPKVVEQPPVAPAPPPEPLATTPPVDEAQLAEESKALVAQAETDIQRARAKRALWLPAWEALLNSREAVAARDHARAIRQAKRASELAGLGLEQLAYPAVAIAPPPESK